MKRTKIFLLAIAAILTLSLPAAAQFRVGPKIGTEINSLHFSSDVKDNFSSSNRAGFTGGITAEFTVPVIGVGCDLSVMYVHRVNNVTSTNSDFKSNKKDYIEIPLHFKYKFGLPVIGKVFTPYVFTGPAISFLTSKKAISEAYKCKAYDLAWNFGVGVQLVSHLQIGASYGLGLTNSYKAESVDGSNINPIQVVKNLKNNYWTVTAAWLF